MTLTDVATKMFKTVKLLAHPVGSIYMSTVDTSPVDLFGGTWEQITDTFLWCAGTSHAAGTTGGEETHKLTVAEMPKHGHTVAWWSTAGSLGTAKNWDTLGANLVNNNAGARVNGSCATWIEGTFTCAQNGVGDQCGITRTAGADNTHNNMPPYLSVYAWKRTA